jgi:primosomal replication protein N
MAHTKNKMKFWRRNANKVTIMVPTERTVTDEAGVETKVAVNVPHILTGRQLRAYTSTPGEKFRKPIGLLKNLMQNAGLARIDLSDVIVSQPEGV